MILSHKWATLYEAGMRVPSGVLTSGCLSWCTLSPISLILSSLRIHVCLFICNSFPAPHSLFYAICSYCHGDGYSMKWPFISALSTVTVVSGWFWLRCWWKGRNLFNKVIFFPAKFAFASPYLCLKFSKWNICPSGLSEIHCSLAGCHMHDWFKCMPESFSSD